MFIDDLPSIDVLCLVDRYEVPVCTRFVTTASHGTSFTASRIKSTTVGSILKDNQYQYDQAKTMLVLA